MATTTHLPVNGTWPHAGYLTLGRLEGKGGYNNMKWQFWGVFRKISKSKRKKGIEGIRKRKKEKNRRKKIKKERKRQVRRRKRIKEKRKKQVRRAGAQLAARIARKRDNGKNRFKSSMKA